MKPMLAIATDLEHVGKYEDYAMEPKLDGVRAIIVKDGSDVQIYSRSGKRFTDKLPHLVRTLKGIDTDFVLDGELGYMSTVPIADPEDPYMDWDWPVINFNSTMRVLGSGPEVAIEKQEEWGPLSFIAFDYLNDTGKNYAARRQMLFDFYHTYLFGVWSDGPHFELIPVNKTWDEKIYHQYVRQGGEGVMLKNKMGLYHPGKRLTGTFVKVKDFLEADVVIEEEFLPGQGKYEGMIGAIYFGAYTMHPEGAKYNRIGKCSGMTDGQREEFTRNFDDYAGMTMTIRHFGFIGAERNGLRHPQFVRLRPDKPPIECRWSDIFPHLV